ncbi:DUF763 domain-containing protein [Candidatus Peregrinibacteria bacterium CG_4_10_14_0_2_um_filter_43_11]|nr:MAG: DUF763 domain-containing protein [Candidatus Peregrinibacteria bacterium CG_4_10_14_0_2_um_filter_43_11]
MKRGVATFTLDTGKCPKWLFDRMVKLGREMMRVLVEEYGPDEFIKRIADPVWFQSLGTVLAFDWNASGLTTVLTGALKEALRGNEKEWGFFICGGKGKTSLKTPDQIQNWGNRLQLPEAHTKNLIYNSKMSAKVDSALVQDGFTLYHHTFFFSKNGAWTVVQQGMNRKKRTARRYHWHSENVKDLIIEPHTGIASQSFENHMLNMTAKSGEQNRTIGVELTNSNATTMLKDIQLLRKHSSKLSQTISFKINEDQMTLLNLEDHDFHTHSVVSEEWVHSRYLDRILLKLVNDKPKNYEDLVATPGVGPKTIRALALVAEVIYGAKASYTDPARYSFAHGGKDHIPYPVDRGTYDQTIQTLEKAIRKTRLEPKEKNEALQKLIKIS